MESWQVLTSRPERRSAARSRHWTAATLGSRPRRARNAALSGYYGLRRHAVTKQIRIAISVGQLPGKGAHHAQIT